MTAFIYRARDKNGRLVRGVVDSADDRSAAVSIERMGLSPVSISVKAGVRGITNLWNRQFRKIGHQDVVVFTRQLSTLIATGSPLIQSINNVYEQTDNIRFKQVIGRLSAAIEGGLSFSKALSQFPEVFPLLYVSLIRVGESGGILASVLNRLADLGTQEIDLRSRLHSALVYPVVLAVVAFLIVNFVLVGVLPKFVAIFEASSAKLPLPTKALLFVSGVLRSFWWLIAIGAAFFLNWFRKYYRSTTGRMRIDFLIFRLPLFGPLILKISISRFARSIAALTRSGIPVLEALSVVEASIQNTVLRGVVANVRQAITEGQSLTQPFKASGLFPPMVIQLINTGEHSGRLDDMFDQIATFYEPEIETTVRNLTSLLEPAMLLGMGMVVAFIALSVLLPIFNLISIIRR